MHYVYVLQNKKTKKLYFGYTSNLEKRIREHRAGDTKSTNIDGSWRIIYYEAYLGKKDATEREWNLKHQGRQRDFLKGDIQNSLNLAAIV